MSWVNHLRNELMCPTSGVHFYWLRTMINTEIANIDLPLIQRSETKMPHDCGILAIAINERLGIHLFDCRIKRFITEGKHILIRYQVDDMKFLEFRTSFLVRAEKINFTVHF